MSRCIVFPVATLSGYPRPSRATPEPGSSTKNTSASIGKLARTSSPGYRAFAISTAPGDYLSRLRTLLKAEPVRSTCRGPPYARPPSRYPDRPLAALLAPRIKIAYMIHAASSPSRAPESLPSIKTPANKLRCYLHEHLLIRTRCFGATAWSRRARTPLVRPGLRPTPATPRTRRRCPGAGHRRRPKRSSRRLHDGGGFEQQKP